jgi:hypothetical protein
VRSCDICSVDVEPAEDLKPASDEQTVERRAAMNLPGFNRRDFFLRASMAGALSALPGGKRLAAMAAKAAQESMSVYTRLGLRPIINASGTYTHLGGSPMPAEVIDATKHAAQPTMQAHVPMKMALPAPVVTKATSVPVSWGMRSPMASVRSRMRTCCRSL